MQYYGVSGNELAIFQSFMAGRKQFVTIDTYNSDILNSLECSVIQGSKLSAILYTLFTNEITLLPKIMGTDKFKV